MKRNLMLLFFAFSFHLNAQKTLLFELTKNGNPNKSYLFGTIHVADEIAYSFNDSVFWAIQNTKSSAFEIDFKQDTLSKEQLGKAIMGKLTPESFSKILEVFKNNLIPLIMQKFTPKQLSNLINKQLIPKLSDYISEYFSKRENSRNRIIDDFLQNYARTNGKQIIGIETADEQYSAIMDGVNAVIVDENFTKNLISEFEKINSNSDQTKQNTVKNNLKELYSKFDLTAINASFDDTLELSKFIKYYLIEKRNKIMFDRTIHKIDTQSIFIAVGSGHLAGEKGLINYYKQAGYTVRPMNLSANFRFDSSIQWQDIKNEQFYAILPLGKSSHESIDKINCKICEYSKKIISPKGELEFKIKKYPCCQEDTSQSKLSYEEFMKELNSRMLKDTSRYHKAKKGVSIDTNQINDIKISSIKAPKSDKSTLQNQALNQLKNFELDSAQKKYFREFFSFFKKDFDPKSLTNFLQTSSIFKSPTISTSTITIQGKNYELITSNSLIENTKSVKISKGDEEYKLSISGDINLLNDPKYNTFFTSFKIYEK